MKNENRLSLAELKEKANSIDDKVALEMIKGGNWNDCHGCPTFWSKVKSYLKDAVNSAGTEPACAPTTVNY